MNQPTITHEEFFQLLKKLNSQFDVSIGNYKRRLEYRIEDEDYSKASEIYQNIKGMEEFKYIQKDVLSSSLQFCSFQDFDKV